MSLCMFACIEIHPTCLVDSFCATLTTGPPQDQEGAEVEQSGRNPDRGHMSRK